jgi:hypothetical protein
MTPHSSIALGACSYIRLIYCQITWSPKVFPGKKSACRTFLRIDTNDHLFAPRVGRYSELGSMILAKVNSPWLYPRFVIALHSPTTSWKPDCDSGLRRKAGTFTPVNPHQSVLSGPVCLRTIAKNGHVSRISG